MKKTNKRLTLDKCTIRVLSKNDLQDVVGGTSGACTGASACGPCAETNNSCRICYQN
jgi:natural product precursor